MDVIDTNNNVIRKALRLSLNEMAVLREIFMLSQSRKYDHYCVKSKANIAYTLDLSERTVFNIIEKLEMYNLIVKNDYGHLALSPFMEALVSERDNIALAISTDGYQLATSKIAERIIDDMKNNSEQYKVDYAKNAEGMQKVQNTYAKSADDLCKNCIPPMQNLHTSNNNNNNTEEDTVKIDGQKSVKKDFDPITFDEFWNQYGKKEKKSEAQKKWAKISKIEKQKIKDTLAMFLSRVKDKQYLPHPVTYLNQKRWEDEVVPLVSTNIQDDEAIFKNLVYNKKLVNCTPQELEWAYKHLTRDLVNYHSRPKCEQMIKQSSWKTEADL